jgi:hypothetical protein
MIKKLLQHYLNGTYTDRVCTIDFYSEIEGESTVYIKYDYVYSEGTDYGFSDSVTVSMLELIAFVYSTQL